MGNKSTKNKQDISEKAVSKLLKSKRFQEIWTKIHSSGIQPLYDAIQQAEKSNTTTIQIAQNQIVTTYDIIVDLPQDTKLRAALYAKYKIELTEYFNNKYIPLFKQIKTQNNDAQLVNEFCKHWIYASTVSRTMAQMFRYLDRHYIKRQSGEIKTMSVQAYQSYYQIIKPYINDICAIIVEFIQAYRKSGESEPIPGLTIQTIHDVIKIFIDIAEELEQNTNAAINKIMQDVETSYTDTFTPNYWNDKSVSDCIAECKIYEQRENALFEKCLMPTVYYKNTSTYLFHSMINNKWPILLNDILEKKFKQIEISAQDYECVKQLNNWASLSGKKKLAWQPYTNNAVGKMYSKCQSRFYIETLIHGLGRGGLNAYGDNSDVPADIVAICLRYYEPKSRLLHLFIFVREMLLELYHAVKMHSFLNTDTILGVNTVDAVKMQMVEINSICFDVYRNWSTVYIPFHTMAAEYIDGLFYLDNSSSDIKQKLNYFSQLFLFWDYNTNNYTIKRSVNAFVTEHMKLMCHRLLSERRNIKLETLLVNEFEKLLVNEFQTISKQSKSLIKDIEQSDKLCKQFYENKENDILQTMEFNVTHLPMMNITWKYLKGMLIYNKPGCMEIVCLKYSDFCMNNRNHSKKVDFALNFGYGEIEIEFNNNIKKIFIVSTAMILIFEAFNFKDKYSMKYFQKFCKSKFGAHIIEENLAFLTRFGLLLEENVEEKKDDEIYWSINENFESPMNRINLYHMFQVYKNSGKA